jgi:hypothetical protein
MIRSELPWRFRLLRSPKFRFSEKKGLFRLTPAVTVAYRKDARNNRTTWSVPKEMVDYGNSLLFIGDKRQANPCTADEFAEY